MKSFFGEDVLLNSETAKELYKVVKDLPIIDYHCHLNQQFIRENVSFNDIGELWLKEDHYKWRAMRLCNVDEKYITGSASYHDKFIKYASIMPKLIGNPLYYWTHFELKQIFNINEPLSEDSAEKIYQEANQRLKEFKVRDLLKHFNVKYIATTDDPCDDLAANGVYGDIKVAPTFRPDKAFDPQSYIKKLENAVGHKIISAQDYLTALINRLDYFVNLGAKITDHGFYHFPKKYIDDKTAEKLFIKKDNLNEEEKSLFFGWLLVKLAKEYKKRNLIMQIHFAVIRNNNKEMFDECGPDSGFDLIGKEQDVEDLILFLNQFDNASRPKVVLYTLNDANLKAIAAVSGAFKNVRLGAAWWFNDTVEGIKNNLSVICEYSILGTHLGMLTDSRSFSSYSRFDFFRRILCDFVAEKVNKGEYDRNSASKLVEDICYKNIKETIEQHEKYF